MKVIISNCFPDDNRGGAALTIATVEFVQAAFPDAQIALLPVREYEDPAAAFRHCLAAHPEVKILPSIQSTKGRRGGSRAAARFLWSEATGRGRTESLRAIEESSLVVSKGGRYFLDRPSVADFLGLLLLCAPLVRGIRSGTPTVVVGAHIGPCDHRRTRLLLRWVFRRLTHVVVRDSRSAINARTLGVDSRRLSTLPDNAFWHAGLTLDAAGIEQFGLTGQPYAVFVPGRGFDQERAIHKEAFVKLAESCTQQGLAVVIVVQVEPPEDIDRQVAKDLHAEIPESILIDDDLTIAALCAVYAGAAALVTNRLHAAIFALLAGTVPVALRIGPKASWILGDLKLGDLVVGADRSDADAIQVLEAVLDQTVPTTDIGLLVAAERQKLLEVPRILRRCHETSSIATEERRLARRLASPPNS